MQHSHNCYRGSSALVGSITDSITLSAPITHEIFNPSLGSSQPSRQPVFKPQALSIEPWALGLGAWKPGGFSWGLTGFGLLKLQFNFKLYEVTNHPLGRPSKPRSTYRSGTGKGGCLLTTLVTNLITYLARCSPDHHRQRLSYSQKRSIVRESLGRVPGPVRRFLILDRLATIAICQHLQRW